MRKKILSLITILTIFLGIIPLNITFANEDLSYTELNNIDRWTFNEYWYKITKLYALLDEDYKVNFVINSQIANQILNLVEKWYKYLPDNLDNEGKYRDVKVALKLGLKYPNNDTYFNKIRKSLKSFVQEPIIQKVKAKIIATPKEGNAPLITTFRAEAEDPSWTTISKRNYIWWMNIWGKKVIIGNRTSISHTFTEEWTYTVFLWVKSSHKNKNGNVDVLPYLWTVKVKVKEKIASVILRISWKSLNFDDELKVSPDDASYWLIFDATSSVPASGTKIIKTTWNFGNGVKKSYSGSPKIERIIYSREWDYEWFLELTTNQWKTIKKKFRLLVHKPIASIKVNKTEWFIWDKFNFYPESHWNSKYLSYSWSIVNTKKDKEIIKKIWKNFNYSFQEKWQYSVKLIIKDASGHIDVDTKTIYINSRPPVANLQTSIPYSNKPNKVFFDATASFDPDYNDDGNLKYFWTIDWENVNLEESNDDGSNWFYTFSTIWDHSIVLKVEDPDGLTSIIRKSVKVKSILSLDFSIYPRVVQREKVVRFRADSQNAKFYTWDFGDGEVKSTKSSKISHSYKKSWIFPVKLIVRGKWTDKNEYTKNVYIGDSKNPVSVINIKRQMGFSFKKEKKACKWNDAYIASRKDNLIFSWEDSIDTNGQNMGLSYSWLIGKDKYKTWKSITERFDELGCHRIKLTVKSDIDKTTDSSEIWVKVKNMPPEISGLKISAVDTKTDPVIVNVSAIWTKDPDGVIQSYLWYYTTDVDNEAQDFRITKTPKTTFVIPKIQGTYYFGLIMKDNNWAKVNTEDLVKKIGNNFLELQWDNTNTPLIDFSVSDSSVAIGQEVSFRAIAKNIRWDNISSTAKFSWDFDWDWFYEIKKSNKSTITYKYKKSGTFYPKVKVTNKGFSNTRTLTVNVYNKLKADFKYISVWNKFILIDTSKWTIDKNSWDLWDGTKDEDKQNILHKYKDKKSFHNVELSVSEWTKVKKITKEVDKNLRNILKTRKKWIHIFSFPKMWKEWNIVLDNEDDVYIYLWESKWDFKYYGIDYDISVDSNQNWWNDDDIDNDNKESFKNGSPEKIELNNNKEQIVRVFLLDENKKVVDSKDIKIIKNYIKEEQVKVWEFKGVSVEEKAQIEELKIELTKLDQKYRLEAMKYLQKLQENWDDKTEKVRTIIDFEKFIEKINPKNKQNITKILDWFVSSNSDDQKEVSFQALKALIPDEIECRVDSWNCKDYLVSKLNIIKQSSNIEQNRANWKDILEVIGKTKLMSKEQKSDFKWILRQLVYSWTENIPKKELEEQKKDDNDSWKKVDTPKIKANTGENTDSIFSKILIWVVIAFVGIIAILFIIWLVDFLKNRKSWESFNDFVDKKTKDDDVLWDFEDPLEQKTKQEEIEDPLAQTQSKKSAIFTPEVNLEEKKEEDKKQDNQEIKQEEEKVPDWLSWSLDNDNKNLEQEEEKNQEKDDKEIEEENLWFSLDVPEEEKKEEVEKNNEEVLDEDNNEEVPDWLKWSLDTQEENKQEENKQENKIEKETQEEVIEEKNSDDDNNEIPDWLQWSLDWDEKESQEEDNNKILEQEENREKDDKEVEEEENQEELEEDNFDLEKETSIDLEEDNTPDWLKDSLKENKNEKQEKNKEQEENKTHLWDPVKLDEEDIPDWLKESVEEKKEEKKQENTKKTKKIKNTNTRKKSWRPKKQNNKKQENKEVKKEENSKEKDNTKKDEQLWDDWMDIPDWLKTE